MTQLEYPQDLIGGISFWLKTVLLLAVPAT